MQLRPQLLELRVDLHGIHVARAVRQRDGDVIAVAGTDDQDVVEFLRRISLVRHEVRRVARPPKLDRLDRWCGMPFDVDVVGPRAPLERAELRPCSTATS